jgi:type II secretory pathway pseudopilin PulG
VQLFWPDIVRTRRSLTILREALRRLRLHSGQEGSVMIEVLAGMIILGIATAAVLQGLDGAQATGVKNKNRSVAATLAQQDIERIRATPVTSLANLNETRTVDVRGVDYTVVSRTDWVRDETGVVSCTSDETQAEYLKVTSTVSSPASLSSPVKETTLLTPGPGAFSATAGTAAVQLTDRTGAPITNVSVDLSGPSSLSSRTNELGCAIFGFVPAGSYVAEVDGWVRWSSDGSSTAEVEVHAGKTSLTHLELERAASLRANFRTPAGGAAAWTAMSVANAKLPGGASFFSSADPAIPIDADTTPVGSIDATGLFPFLDGYGVYAGTCRKNNPAFWKSNYFQTSGKGFVLLQPGDILRDVTVEMPTVRVTATRASAFLPRLVIRQTDTQCVLTMYDLPRATGTAATQWIYPAPPNPAPNPLPGLPLPFGNYNVCVDFVSSGTTRRRSTTVDLTGRTSADFTRAVTINLDSSLTNGACPTS